MYSSSKYTLMKTLLPSPKQILLLFFFSLCFCGAHAQVLLDKAELSSKVRRFNDSDFVISGLRITRPDSNHYNLPANDTLKMNGTAIYLGFCKRVVIRDCIIGPTGGQGIYLEGCDSVTITNCIFFDNDASIITWASSRIKIINNQFTNVWNEIKRLNHPCYTRETTYPYNIQGSNGRSGGFVDLRLSFGGGNLIQNNVGENVMNHSCPEDLINVSHSSFQYDRPLVISNNKFRGGGPSATGGGIMIADDIGDSAQPITSNVVVYNNKLVDPGQYGISATGGINITIDNNQIYGRSQRFTNVGMAAGDGYGWGVCNNIKITNNMVNYIGRWPLGSDTAYPNPFYLPNAPSACNISSAGRDSIWNYNGNIFNATSIDESILPDRLLTPFPVVKLKFDNDFTDISGSHLNATAYGSTSIVCDGSRKAVSLNGTSSDVMTLPKSVWLQPESQMISVSAWIKPYDLSLVRGFIRSQNSYGYLDGWRCVVGNGTNYFTPLVGTDNGKVAVNCDGIVQNAWNFVAFTYDGKVLKGYVNGILKDSAFLAGNIVYNNNTNLAIGGSEGTYNFYGEIADVSIYHGIRSAIELLAEYNSVLPEFNGTARNSNIVISSTYYANGQSKPLESISEVKNDSYGEIVPYADGVLSYELNLIAGNPNYQYTYGIEQIVSIPSGGYAKFEVRAYPAYCMVAGSHT